MATSHFNCWATVPGGAIKRLDVYACCQRDALRLAFDAVPGAVCMSCRETEVDAFVGQPSRSGK